MFAGISAYIVQRLEFQISLGEIMPKFRLRSKLFSHSCVDLSNGRNGQSTTAKAAKSGSKWYTSGNNSKEPDVVHWKSKVCASVHKHWLVLHTHLWV